VRVVDEVSRAVFEQDITADLLSNTVPVASAARGNPGALNSFSHAGEAAILN
jgi:hypothetical protein